jgi:hypothetical protein
VVYHYICDEDYLGLTSPYMSPDPVSDFRSSDLVAGIYF